MTMKLTGSCGERWPIGACGALGNLHQGHCMVSNGSAVGAAGLDDRVYCRPCHLLS